MPDVTKRFRDAATNVALMALVTGSWLMLLDRMGLVLARAPLWCGAACGVRLTSVHVAAALLVSTVVLCSQALLRRQTGWRWHLALGALAALFMLASSVAFSYAVRTPKELASQHFRFLVASGVAAIGGVAVACIALLRRKKAFPVLVMLGSLLFGIIDATIYPGQVPDVHLGIYVMQAASACVGLGMPVARALQARRFHAPVAWGLLTVMFVGGADAWLRERASTASASRVVRRLLHAVPKSAPGHALNDALEAGLREIEPPPVSSGRSPERRPFSVLLVTVDSLRADALPTPTRGSYLRGNETPFLDGWLPKTTRFVNAYASGPMTLESMFSTLRGVSVADAIGGTDIPSLSRPLGLATAAIVPWFFGVEPQYGASIQDFDRVDFYDLDRQDTQMATIDEALSELHGERFFIWTHFFCVHLPYCGGGRPLSQGLQSPFEVLALKSEYRQAVGWMDQQMKRLVRTLERVNRAESTIVILGSDHGEHLGEGLVMGHGDALHDLEIHVPLAIYVPGMRGGIVRALTSNGQVLPTVLDLLGEPPAPAQTAPSLLPAMLAAHETSPQGVYVKGIAAKQHAVVTQDRLVLYDEAVGAFSWLPRSPGLVDGSAAELSLTPAEERAATAQLVRAHPDLFFATPRAPHTLELLRTRLAEVTARTRGEDLDFLLRVAAHVKEPSLSAVLEHAYAITPSPERKVRTALHLVPLDGDYWSNKLGDLLASSIGTSSELPVLRALTAYGQSRLGARPDLARRPSTLGPGDEPMVIAAWLELFASGKNRALSLRPIRNLATLLPGPQTAEGTRRVLAAVAAVELESRERSSADAQALATWVRSQVSSPVRAERLGASRALGKVGTKEDVPRLTYVADHDPSIAVRRAARKALDLILKR